MNFNEDLSTSALTELQRAAEALRRHSETAQSPRLITKEELADVITHEVASGLVVIDAEGFSPNGRELVGSRAREYLQACENLFRVFTERFQPFEAKSNEIAAIPAKIIAFEQTCENEISTEKRRIEADQLSQNLKKSKERFEAQVDIHAHQPNMKAVSSNFLFDVNPFYMSLMILLGIAEWFINYDTLFLFFGIPVIAIGATFVLGASLSLIAHQHGADLKQWRRKFGSSIESKNRPYGVLILATLGLIGLVTVTGWMRYQALMGVLEMQTSANILGTKYSVRIDPTREVIISLGSNILAWLVGVFISYLAHDPDPVYVATKLDYLKAEKKFENLKRTFERRSQLLRSQAADKISELNYRLLKLEADPSLKEALTMYRQAKEQMRGFYDRTRNFIVTEYANYRLALINVLSGRNDVSLMRSTGSEVAPITLNDFRNLKFSPPDNNFSMSHTSWEKINVND